MSTLFKRNWKRGVCPRSPDDVEAATGIRPNYVPYNVIDPDSVPLAIRLSVPEGVAQEEGVPEVEPVEPEVIPE